VPHGPPGGGDVRGIPHAAAPAAVGTRIIRNARGVPAMTVLAWDPIRFDVGVAKMNAEHEVLVGLMNAIHGRVDKAFFDFLSLWLRSHICHLDTRYAKNLARRTG